MNVKIGKKLGAGMMGTVYASTIDDQPAITKIEKYDGDLTTASNYIRQLKFNDLAKQYPDLFMTLVFSGVKEMCTHEQPIGDHIDDVKIIRELTKKNELTQCCILSYVPVLDGTWDSLRRSLTRPLSSKAYHSALHQLITACNVLRTYKYVHRDVHPRNIMYKKLPRGKYMWYLIDYGTIGHKSFAVNDIDRKTKNNAPDIIGVVWTFSNNALGDYMSEHKIKYPPYKKFIKHIKKSDEYSDIKKYLPPTKNKIILNECIALVTMIKHYNLYMDALGMPHDEYAEYYTTQDHPETLLYIIAHCAEPTYDTILTYLKRKL